jgi:hypothetical protein
MLAEVVWAQNHSRTAARREVVEMSEDRSWKLGRTTFPALALEKDEGDKGKR